VHRERGVLLRDKASVGSALLGLRLRVVAGAGRLFGAASGLGVGRVLGGGLTAPDLVHGRA